VGIGSVLGRDIRRVGVDSSFQDTMANLAVWSGVFASASAALPNPTSVVVNGESRRERGNLLGRREC